MADVVVAPISAVSTEKQSVQAPPTDAGKGSLNVASSLGIKMPGKGSRISISSTDVNIHPELLGGEVQEQVELTQEVLERMWGKMLEDKADNAELVSLLADRRLEVKDATTFDICVNNNYFESEFKAFQTEVLTYLRNKCNNQSIVCKITVELQEKKQVVYKPRERYEAMKEKNAALIELHKFFEDIDY